MDEAATHARLLIQGQYVGDVVVQGSDASWGYGQFRPRPEFGQFATLFGTWSLLMHADEQDPVLSPAASEELRQVEYQIDQLKAQLHLIKDDVVMPISS